MEIDTKNPNYTLIYRFDNDVYIKSGLYETIKHILEDVYEVGYDKLDFITNDTNHELQANEALLLENGINIIPNFGINVEFKNPFMNKNR